MRGIYCKVIGREAAERAELKHAFGAQKLNDLAEGYQIREFAATVLGAVFDANFGLLDAGEDFGQVFARDSSRFVFERAVHDADGIFFALRIGEIPDEMRSNAATRPAS